MAETVEFCEGRSLGGRRLVRRPEGRPRGFRQMMAEASGREPRFDHFVVWKLRCFAGSVRL